MKLNILFVTDSIPFLDNGGAEARYFNLIRRISQKHNVWLISLNRSPGSLAHLAEIKKHCVVVEAIPWRRPFFLSYFFLVLARTIFRLEPPVNSYYSMKKMRSKINSFLKRQPIDIVQIEHSFMAPYVDAIPAEVGCKKVLTVHNVGELLFRRMFSIERRPFRKIEYWFDWILSRRWESQLCNKFDQCFTISTFDEKVIQERNPRLSVVTVPNGVDPGSHFPFPMDPDSTDILMVGNLAYTPNRDAALYFVRTIFPLIQGKKKKACLTIVGDNPPRELLKLARNRGVKITGHVPTILPYYKSSALLAVPLRAGSGVRGKIVESMALGRPVVSTSLGCEGLDVIHGKTILIGDSPGDFADCVIRLLNGCKLRQEIAKNARTLVENFHNWDRSAKTMVDSYEKMTQSL
ncbi:MAG: glycosyltransferase [Elusimicrobia bacterium]|nr:glycosyltransferase [Elusimicrobiota bacterium]